MLIIELRELYYNTEGRIIDLTEYFYKEVLNVRKTVSINELLVILDISMTWFYKCKAAGLIPPPDDTERTPHIWNVDNNDLVKFIESRNKLAQFTQFINS